MVATKTKRQTASAAKAADTPSTSPTAGHADPRDEGKATPTEAPMDGSAERTELRQTGARLAGGPIALTEEGTREILAKQKNTPYTEDADTVKGQTPSIGRVVRFTRGGLVRAAIISGVRPARDAESEELPEDEAKEVQGLSQRELETRNLTRDGDAGPVKRRFPLPEQPETVDLHILVPVVGSPIEFVEAVPFDAEGKQDVSWSWPAGGLMYQS
jgi:hypothetical protein